MSAAFEKVYEQDDRGPSQNLKTVLSTSNTDTSLLAQFLLDNEYEIMSGQEKTEKKIAPIVLRAQFVKKQLEETKTLTANLENREAEIRQLKLASKMKQSELSEMQIRKDLAEKKLSVLQNDHEINTEKLQRKYDETCQTLKKLVYIFFKGVNVNCNILCFFLCIGKRKSLKKQWTICRTTLIRWKVSAVLCVRSSRCTAAKREI